MGKIWVGECFGLKEMYDGGEAQPKMMQRKDLSDYWRMKSI
jgi:hypothetical protein